jgi:hypothetical protein
MFVECIIYIKHNGVSVLEFAFDVGVIYDSIIDCKRLKYLKKCSTSLSRNKKLVLLFSLQLCI